MSGNVYSRDIIYIQHSDTSMNSFYAGFAGKVAGQSFPEDGDGTYKIVKYEPLGVCSGICAWNGTHGKWMTDCKERNLEQTC